MPSGRPAAGFRDGQPDAGSGGCGCASDAAGGGWTDDTQYTIRWFLYDGKGTLKYNKKALKANDRYPLLTDDFRLYYTSASSDSHSFIVVIEDNHGQSQQLDFKFNRSATEGDACQSKNDNDEEETATTEKGGQSIEAARPKGTLARARTSSTTTCASADTRAEK